VRTEAFPILAFSRSLFKKNAAVHRHGRSGPLRWRQRPRDALPTPCASWDPSMPRCARQLKQNSCSGAPRLAARTQTQSRRCLELREAAAKTKLFKPIGDKATRRRLVSPRSKTGSAAEDFWRSCHPAASAVLRALCAVRLLFSTSTPKSDRRGEARFTTRSSPRA